MARKPRRASRSGAASGATGLEKVRALSHPLRLKLLELFVRQPRTTKQAAVALGEAPTRLYHHVAALERAGLIRLRETRPNRGTIEKYYEAVAAHTLTRVEAEAVLRDSTPEDRAAIGMVVFDQGREDLARAMASGRARLGTLVAMRGVLRLSPVGARYLKRELRALIERLRARSKAERRAAPARRRRRSYSLTLALVPTEDGDAES